MKWLRTNAANGLIVAISVAACLIAVSGAGARVIPSVATSFTQAREVPPTAPTGATTWVDDPYATLGSHADYTVDVAFSYGATGEAGPTGSGIEDPATYPGGADFRENVLDVLVDSPPGLVGNPNALPFADRCDPTTFETGVCPDSSIVGSIDVTSTLLPLGGDEGGPTAPVMPGGTYPQLTVHPYNPLTPPGPFDGYTKLTMLQSVPEVPTTIGIFVQPPLGLKPIRQRLVIAPDPNGQLRMRSVTNGIDHELRNGADAKVLNIRVDRQKLRFFGVLPNGHAFMTNSTVCEKWHTTVYAKAWNTNDNLDSDPLGTGTPGYAESNTDTVTPDCTNFRELPFPMKGNVAISSPDRNTSPDFDFTIENPGVMVDGQVSVTPKSVVTTIPASINVDVAQIGRVCPIADFNADSCPALSRVGSVRVQLPLVVDGLAGDVYLVKQNSTSGLPDLGLRLRGAFGFTQLGSNRYVGEKFNQIETKFDNIPPAGFTKLSFHLDGGPNGLLRTLKCPTYNKAPAVPNFSYAFTSWNGESNSEVMPLNLANCFGIQTLHGFSKCLHSRLSVRPNYQSRTRVRKVQLRVDGRLKTTNRHTPYRFNLALSKLKLKSRKRHKLELRAHYDDGAISKKITYFKVCKSRK